jgi:hypothetical protein
MLATITFVMIILFFIAFTVQGSRKFGGGVIWWIKLFVVYVALIFCAFFLWILTLPVFVGLKRLPPIPIIIVIHNILSKIMIIIFPIGITIAVVLYMVYRIFQPIILGVSLGIVNIRNHTPFKEFWDTGVFDFIEALLALDFRRMWSSALKIVVKTPDHVRELFSNEIRIAKESAEAGKEEALAQKEKMDKAIEKCIAENTIELTPNMSASERTKAEKENAKAEVSCRNPIG